MRNNKPIDAKKLEESYAEILFRARDEGVFHHSYIMSNSDGILADRLTEWGFFTKAEVKYYRNYSYHLTFKGHWLAYNFKRMIENEPN